MLAQPRLLVGRAAHAEPDPGQSLRRYAPPGLPGAATYNLLCWLKLLVRPAGERSRHAKRLRFRFIAIAATVGQSGRRIVLRVSAGYALYADFVTALHRIRGLARAPA